MEQRNPELEAGPRRKAAERLARPWLAKLAALVGAEVPEGRFLPLEETDKLKAAFFERVKGGPAVRLFWDADRASQLRSTLEHVRQQAPSEAILLSREPIGGLLIPSGAVLGHAFEVMEATASDLTLATADLADGLLLEHNHYGHVGDQAKDEYELTTWGSFSPGDDAVAGGRKTSRYL